METMAQVCLWICLVTGAGVVTLAGIETWYQVINQAAKVTKVTWHVALYYRDRKAFHEWVERNNQPPA